MRKGSATMVVRTTVDVIIVMRMTAVAVVTTMMTLILYTFNKGVTLIIIPTT